MQPNRVCIWPIMLDFPRSSGRGAYKMKMLWMLKFVKRFIKKSKHLPSARWGHFCTYMQILKFTFNHLFWILKKSKGNRCRIHYLCYSPIALKICSLCIFKIGRNLSLLIYKCGTQFQLCKFFFSKSTNTSYQIYIIATFGAFSPTSERHSSPLSSLMLIMCSQNKTFAW